MSAIREYMGDKFDEYKRDGERSVMADQSLSDADRDELLAVIGFMGEQELARRADRRRIDATG